MLDIYRKIHLLTFTVAVLFAACGPTTRQSVSPAGRQIPATGRQVLLKTIDAYSAGDFTAAVLLSDSLLKTDTPADSQLHLLGAYYGLRSRLGLELPADSLTAFLEQAVRLVPEKQRNDLLNVLREPGKPAPDTQRTGPEVAYKIGVVLPLSGQYYEFGEAILEGVKLAVEEYNSGAPEGVKVALDIRDDAGEPVRAASLGRTLAADSSVAALVGSHGNEATLSLALVSASQTIPLVCPTADDPGLDAMGTTIHVLNRTDRKLSSTVADAAVDLLGLHTFAVLAEEDERGKLLASGFIEQVRRDGGTVVADVRYNTETNNFEDQMAVIQRYLPDGIYLTAKSDMITQLASQVHYYGMGKVQLLGGEYWDSERVIRMGGDYVDGGMFSTPFYKDSDKLRWAKFKEMYERSHRRPVNRFSAYGYDAAGLILASMDKLPMSRSQLVTKMHSGREYDGATGAYTIGGDGRVERKYFVLRLASGNIVPAEMALSPREAGGEQTDSTAVETPPVNSPN